MNQYESKFRSLMLPLIAHVTPKIADVITIGKNWSQRAVMSVALSSPPDPLQDRPKPFPPRWIDRLDEPHSAFQVRAKAGVISAVLAVRTEPRAIGQCRFEQIEIRPLHIHVLVDDEAGQVLPHSLTHDARLAVVHGETVLKQDRGNMRGEPLDSPLEFLTARKSKIVRVTRVPRAGRFREPGQAAIESIRTEIRERGRCRRPLRQMRPAIQNTGFLRESPAKIARRGVRTDASKQIGNRFGIPHRAKKSLNPRGSEGGKEVAQVHPQNDPLTHVRGGERPDRSAFEESVYRRMGRNPLQNLGQDLRCSFFK